MKQKLTKLFMLSAASAIGIKVFDKINDFKRGNSIKLSPEKILMKKDSKLKGHRIAFLGSSITYGAASFGDSFPEYLESIYGLDSYKEAVTGTTLGVKKHNNYVNRMKQNIPLNLDLDMFVCQLSTNDGRFNIPIGKISSSYNMKDFDTTTTIGAIEYIIAYVKKNWDCPITFFTCLRKPDSDYEYLINKLYEIQQKWGIYIIDIWDNNKIRIESNSSSTYMFDDAHPTRAGYRYIWTPFLEQELSRILTISSNIKK